MTSHLIAKVSDFGTASLLDRAREAAQGPLGAVSGAVASIAPSATSEAVSDLTAGIGTPAYMAPEVLRQAAYGQAADVFSFGVVMWEVTKGLVPDLVAQARPGRRGGSWLIAVEELYAAGAQLQFAGGTATAAFAALAGACMAYVPEKRPSFAEVVDRLAWVG